MSPDLIADRGRFMAGPGFEPGARGYESLVLPLHHPALLFRAYKINKFYSQCVASTTTSDHPANAHE